MLPTDRTKTEAPQQYIESIQEYSSNEFRPLDSGAASSAACRQGKKDIGRSRKKKEKKEKKEEED